MGQMLSDKMLNPENIGEYAPEEDKLICPKNQDEMQQYRRKNPTMGCPMAFRHCSRVNTKP
jgi:hypothetical protein